ncbi:MAG: WD40/YVTN/BNR-like repeat-containing protein, partial [Myxococcota bacterium]
MIHSRTWAGATAISLSLAAACGAPHKPPASVQTPPASTASVTSAWSYHPIAPRRLLTRMDLGDAQWLFAGKQGERWLVQAREGTAQAAAQLADEDLVAITRPDDTTFAFIGDGGTIYVSSSPLGAFGQMRRIEPAPMRIAAAGKSIVAIGWDGTVRRSVDAGKTFAPVAVGGHPFDALLSDDGRAMLLGFPERLWVSRDDAATWSEAPTPGLGLGMLGLDANGSLVARGVLRSLVWRPEQSPEVADRPWEQAPLGLLTDLQAGPSASALLDGRAVLAGDAYYEVARRDDEGPWYLAAGALTERLEWVPIAQSGACKQMTIGARGRHVVLGCMAGPRGGVLFPALRVMWSRDAGSTFTPPRPTSLVADEESVSLAILPDETLIVSGACQPGARGICSPAGPIRLVPARESRSLQFATVEPSELPAVVGRVGAVHVAHESDRLFATGLLASRRLAVLVSDDRGESFRAVPLDLSDTEVDEEHDVVELLSHMQPGKLTPDWDGTMSWVLHAATGPVWVVLDASGKVLSARFAPEGYPMLEAAGRRGIAFGAEDRFVMQSLDAGSSFSRLTRLPPAPGAAPMAWCGPGGCVFGDTFSRAGWQAEAGGIVDHERGQEDPEPEPPLRTPIVCDVIDGAAGELGDVVSFPSAGDAQRGPWAWSALVVDPKTAAVHVAHAVDMPKHAVSLSTLLRPVPNPDRIALDARPQAEGAAALRYTFRAAADGTPMVGSPMGRVEVAWENQFEGPARRASMVRPGALRAGDVSPRGKGLAAQANVGMLSVAPGGIHVCVHHSCDQPDDR